MSACVENAKTVVVAMSGGVDSATAAALLVSRGHRVVGITMRLYNARGTLAGTGRCCGPRDIEDARRVCSHLDIPFYVVDFEADFDAAVVDPFVDAYLAGETPNPCARCNQHIKFTPLLRRARALGAERLVTGHYARIERSGHAFVLRRGRDPDKDQSYFLASMPARELAWIDFPLGELTKDQVRQHAQSFALPNSNKAESQEICFVPDGDYAGFVERRALSRGRTLPPAGDIVDEIGRTVGTHKGIHHYTVGQRRGLGNVATSGRPVYVMRVDPKSNQVVVGERDRAGAKQLHIGEMQWFNPPSTSAISAAVQVRYRAAPMPAAIEIGDGVAVARFEQPVVAAPGQAAVVYDGDVVLGGGFVASGDTGGS